MASSSTSDYVALSEEEGLSDDSPTETFKDLVRSEGGQVAEEEHSEEHADQLANPADAIAEVKQKAKKAKKKVEAPKYAWTVEAIEAFIKEWETRPLLFDCNHAQYHMKDKRKVALDQICQKLGSVHDISPLPTSDDLLKKMNGLRTYYNAERNKEKASRSTRKGADEIYDSVWQYYESLQFLNDNSSFPAGFFGFQFLHSIYCKCNCYNLLVIHDPEKRAPR